MSTDDDTIRRCRCCGTATGDFRGDYCDACDGMGYRNHCLGCGDELDDGEIIICSWCLA